MDKSNKLQTFFFFFLVREGSNLIIFFYSCTVQCHEAVHTGIISIPVLQNRQHLFVACWACHVFLMHKKHWCKWWWLHLVSSSAGHLHLHEVKNMLCVSRMCGLECETYSYSLVTSISQGNGYVCILIWYSFVALSSSKLMVTQVINTARHNDSVPLISKDFGLFRV